MRQVVLEILKADLIQFKEAQNSLKKHINPMLESITKLGNLNCLKQIACEDTESNQKVNVQENTKKQEPREETTVNQNVPAGENTNKHVTQNFGALLNSSGSSASNVTNWVKIKKSSGNSVNGNGPVTAICEPNNRKRLYEITNSIENVLREKVLFLREMITTAKTRNTN
ncbi:hypothetical protein RO3G_00907 [Rhizopus delemar RA 99-880]|uniref:Uncharacterized protein n=1 Tax=Rhizopus delemar (strain RA 99-880 / ATCC MYA-4621 / FGSC 9543 / NRRL 43880) TaxID=246409 RepID=I1BJ23_RHIO9|nr:hypothetical protein RO3G_00907 [Rhizopus delemar RA 99-880]|eukprot:EIE76203.1 hypothetical protein RO3G_00907 [Rhizopus delemar RA 99-880]